MSEKKPNARTSGHLPTMSEKLYANRIASGHAPRPDDSDPSFTPGVRAALATIEGTAQGGGAKHVLAKADPVALDFSKADAEAAEQIGIVLSGSVQDRINRAVSAHNLAARLAVEAGYLLLSVKAEVEHGQFAAGVESLGLSRQRAAELMRMARLVTDMPLARRDELLRLPKSKVLALASADPDVIEDLIAHGNEDADWSTLSVRDLRKRIATLEADKANVQARLDTAETRLKSVTLKNTLTSLELRTEEIRQETLAFQLGVELNLKGLRKLFDEVNLSPTQMGMEGELRLEQVWFIAHAAAASALDLLAHVHTNVVMQGLPQRKLSGEHMLSPAEAARWMRDAALIQARHEGEKFARNIARAEEQPRGRGRPKKAA